MGKSIDNEAVFLRVYEEYSTSLLNFLYYKTGDMDQAKDYVQETYTRYWINADKVPVEKVKSYLFTIANRLFLDSVTHEKVKLKFQYRSISEDIYMESNPEYIYRESEFKEALENAIAELPEQARIVFLMSRIDKLKNREIAEVLEVSIKTVEKHLTVSLKKLKNRLDELRRLKI